MYIIYWFSRVRKEGDIFAARPCQISLSYIGKCGENTLCSKRTSLAWTNVSRLHVHLVLHVLRSWIERACRFIASTNLFFDCAIVRFLGLRTPFEGKTGQRAKKRCRFNRFLCLRVPLFFLLRGRGEEGLTSLRERLNIGNWNVSGISKFTQFFF